jgi:hypothetical protein
VAGGVVGQAQRPLETGVSQTGSGVGVLVTLGQVQAPAWSRVGQRTTRVGALAGSAVAGRVGETVAVGGTAVWMVITAGQVGNVAGEGLAVGAAGAAIGAGAGWAASATRIPTATPIRAPTTATPPEAEGTRDRGGLIGGRSGSRAVSSGSRP